MQTWEYFRLVPYRHGDGWHFDFAGWRHDHASIDDALATNRAFLRRVGAAPTRHGRLVFAREASWRVGGPTQVLVLSTNPLDWAGTSRSSARTG
jgi:hypothetical protein